MGIPIPPFNPYQPVPNNPFYGVQSWYIQGWQGPLVVGAGLSILYPSATIVTSGGGGGGAVSQIIAGTAISVSPAGGTGNVIVTNTGVTQLVAGAGVAISGGTGSVTISATGGAGTVTLINSGSGLSGGPITTSGTLAIDYACVVDPTDYNAKGAILAGTGVGAYSALAVGLNGTVLTACSGCANGVFWGSSSACDIPCAAITGKGALITGTAAGTVFSQSVGLDGYVLTACAAAGSGLCWAPASGGVSPATPLAEGTVYGCTENSGAYNTSLGAASLGSPGAASAGNVALGYYALGSSNDAVGNTAAGSGAMCALTDGQFNVGSGFLALSALTTGGSNVALGNTSGIGLTTECFNVIIGANAGAAGLDCQVIISDGQGTLRMQIDNGGALSFDGINYGAVGQFLTSGGPGTTPTWTAGGGGGTDATPTAAGIVFGCTTAAVTAVGCNALLQSTGAGNSALGCGALGSVITGTNSTAIGFAALCSATVDNNTALGTCAGKNITTATDNTALGFAAMARGGAGTGSFNTGVGVASLALTAAGAGNTAIGWESGCTIIGGGCNVAVGYRALGCGSAGVSGGGNIAIGANSLPAITTASSNIIIGGVSHAGLATGGCNISIGSLNDVPAGTTCLTTIIGNGFTATQSCEVIIGYGSGLTQASYVQGAVSWTFSSDVTQKSDIQDLTEGLELVEKLQPRTYNFIGGIKEGEEGTPSFGLVAQEVEEAIAGTSLEGRGLVNKTDEEHLGLSYASLTVVLINAVKELSARVKELESK